MRQFMDIKRGYPDAILMFRMGDFYEMFFEDAVTVAPVLDIAVTSRDKGVECPVPMAGVPYHAIGGYLRTLVERGFKVAICEQMETPEQARLRKGPGAKIVRREVVRVVTPGVLVDEEHLRSEEPNYLLAVVPEGEAGGYGVAALDVSCGEFVVLRCADAALLRAALSRLAPREILAEQGLHAGLREALGPACPRLEVRDPRLLPPEVLARVQHLQAEGGGGPLQVAEARAAAMTLAYAEETQPGHTLLIHRLRRHELDDRLILDETSLRNLEVFRTLRDSQRKGSLLWAVDATRTAMGARMLRDWLGAPLRELGAIRERQDAIAALINEPRVRGDLQDRLRDVRDVVRLAARARLGTASPRELGARQSAHLRAGLARGQEAGVAHHAARQAEEELARRHRQEVLASPERAPVAQRGREDLDVPLGHEEDGLGLVEQQHLAAAQRHGLAGAGQVLGQQAGHQLLEVGDHPGGGGVLLGHQHRLALEVRVADAEALAEGQLDLALQPARVEPDAVGAARVGQAAAAAGSRPDPRVPARDVGVGQHDRGVVGTADRGLALHHELLPHQPRDARGHHAQHEALGGPVPPLPLGDGTGVRAVGSGSRRGDDSGGRRRQRGGARCRRRQQQLEDRPPHLEARAGGQRRRRLDAPALHQHAVGRAQVDHLPAPSGRGLEPGVTARDALVLEHEAALGAAPEQHGLAAQLELAPLEAGQVGGDDSQPGHLRPAR